MMETCYRKGLNIDQSPVTTADLPSPSITWNSDSDVAESLAVMMQKERSVYKSCDYLKEILVDDGVIDEEDRTKMVDWCYSVVDICQLERETVALAMEMVDRFLSNKSSTVAMDVRRDRIQFQLLTLSALYISIKISTKVALGSDFFASISRELYPVQEIEAMELVLLQGLSWCISAPTCVQMAHHILTLLATHVTFEKSTWAAILDEVEYQAELAVRDYHFVTQRPSTVAMAAIFNTVNRFGKHESQHESQAFVRAVLSIIKNAEFDSIEVILATRNKLYSVVYGQDDAEVTDDPDQWYLY
ncbi:hypothetical protein ACHAWU_009406 [Discostella pseudostelligera]|uniref:Cyclin N-terminal domain-containing protein n=1 Tax=Discostella pseudostelligera TaxID=259834 RepID=A0ABD3MQ59_9STRA